MKKKYSNIMLLVFYLMWIVFFAKLLFMGEYELYVNPVLKPFLWFMFLFFILSGVFWLRFKSQYTFKKIYLVFLIPFFLLFFTQPQPLGSSTIKKQFGSSQDEGIKGGHYRIISNEILSWNTLLKELKKHESPETDRIWSFLSDKNKVKIKKWNPQRPPNQKLKNVIIKNFNEILDDKNFYDKGSFKNIGLDPKLLLLLKKNNDKPGRNEINQINRNIIEKVFPESIKHKKVKTITTSVDKNAKTDYIISTGPEFYTFWSNIEKDPEQYLGKKIDIKGRFFRSKEDFLKNQAYVSRLVITCCAAHAIPSGIYIESDKLNKLKNDDWITAQGIIELAETKKGLFPVLKLNGFNKIKTESPYIYPVKGADLPSLNLAGGKFKPINSHLLPIFLVFFIIFVFVVTVVGD